MNRRILFAVIAVAVSVSGLLYRLNARSHLKKPSVQYHYQLTSTGGMGPKLQIESNWEGSVLVSPGANAQEFILLPSSTRARIAVNGTERPDLVDKPLQNYEKPFRVQLDASTGLTRLIEFAPQLIAEEALNSLLENQLRNLAHLVFVPTLDSGKTQLRAPCLTGICDYRLGKQSSKDSFAIIRKTISGLLIEGRLQVKTDEQGLVSIKGREDSVDTGSMGAETHTQFLLERTAGEEQVLTFDAQNSKSIGPSIPEMSVEQKREIVTQQLQKVSLDTILKSAQDLPTDSNQWGTIYTQLKDLMWLKPEEAKKAAQLLKNTSPKKRIFTSLVNALSSQGTAESQSALIEVVDHYQKEPKVAQSILISLAQTQNPTSETRNYLTDHAHWDDSTSKDSNTLLARRLSGTVARTLGDTGEAKTMIAPALSWMDAAASGSKVSKNELIEAIEVLGNSGHSSIQSGLERIIQGSFDPSVKASAWSALRFVPGENVTQELFQASQGANEDDAKAARGALDLRCSIVPGECSLEVREWLKSHP